jgi:hypothetical protein
VSKSWGWKRKYAPHCVRKPVVLLRSPEKFVGWGNFIPEFPPNWIMGGTCCCPPSAPAAPPPAAPSCPCILISDPVGEGGLLGGLKGGGSGNDGRVISSAAGVGCATV